MLRNCTHTFFRVINRSTSPMTTRSRRFTGRVRRCSTRQPMSPGTRGHLDDPTRGNGLRDTAATGEEVRRHYRNGVRTTRTCARTRRTGFFAGGGLHYEERYSAGRRHDGPGGVAAVRKWRADGTLRHELHYRYGSRAR